MMEFVVWINLMFSMPEFTMIECTSNLAELEFIDERLKELVTRKKSDD